jgi:hypothetical protein
MERMGARSIPRDEFLDLLRRELHYETLRGSWKDMSEFG